MAKGGLIAMTVDRRTRTAARASGQRGRARPLHHADGAVRVRRVRFWGPHRVHEHDAVQAGPLGTGWGVAWAAAFLASDEARWITGVVLPVDAGATAGKNMEPPDTFYVPETASRESAP